MSLEDLLFEFTGPNGVRLRLEELPAPLVRLYLGSGNNPTKTVTLDTDEATELRDALDDFIQRRH